MRVRRVLLSQVWLTIEGTIKYGIEKADSVSSRMEHISDCQGEKGNQDLNLSINLSSTPHVQYGHERVTERTRLRI